MNREILFRGKRIDGKGWVEGDLIHDRNSDKYFIVTEFLESTIVNELSNVAEVEVIPETVGQYTGLLDKNGKRIFEGDIVEIHNPDNRCRYKCEVYYSHLSFDFICLDCSMLKGHVIAARTIFTPDCYEVIGNIHESLEERK